MTKTIILVVKNKLNLEINAKFEKIITKLESDNEKLNVLK